MLNPLNVTLVWDQTRKISYLNPLEYAHSCLFWKKTLETLFFSLKSKNKYMNPWNKEIKGAEPDLCVFADHLFINKKLDLK